MLKSPAFQKTDLFWCRQPFCTPFIQSIQNLFCLSCIFDFIRHNAQLFQCLFLLLRWRSHFPPKRGNIAGQVFCLDGHFKLQRIHQFLLRFFISASCFAKASSLCATTSSDAFCSASSRSTGMPASFPNFLSSAGLLLHFRRSGSPDGTTHAALCATKIKQQ